MLPDRRERRAHSRGRRRPQALDRGAPAGTRRAGSAVAWVSAGTSLPAVAAVPALPLVIYGYSIIGSGGAHPQSTKAMLRFCAKHDIKPVIEKFPMTQKGITDAMTKLEEGKMRYRGVVVV